MSDVSSRSSSAATPPAHHPARRPETSLSPAGPEPVVIEDFTSPGDIAVLTAALTALHRRYPGRFATDVRTSCPPLWEHNPFLTPLPDAVRTVKAQVGHDRAAYATIHSSGQRPIHVLEAYCEGLALELGLERLTPQNWLEPSIRLSDEEKAWLPQVQERTGRRKPYWIVNSGVKPDYTAKAWQGYQRVVDMTRHAIAWVQVGSLEHFHSPLEGIALDLLGQTDLRQLVRLVYHAEGVLCGVTALQHLAHWVEPGPDNRLGRRQAAIIAGGRESPHWFAYPGQQIFHTIGELDCCAAGGCWKARVKPLREYPEHNSSLCLHPRGDQGLCMERIDPELVARVILRLAS